MSVDIHARVAKLQSDYDERKAINAARNRADFPGLWADLQTFRSLFGHVRVRFASNGTRTVGRRMPAGVPATVSKSCKRAYAKWRETMIERGLDPDKLVWRGNNE